jgi:hypothetical protein
MLSGSINEGVLDDRGFDAQRSAFEELHVPYFCTREFPPSPTGDIQQDSS